MRTSKISRDTSRILGALSPNRRSTRNRANKSPSTTPDREQVVVASSPLSALSSTPSAPGTTNDIEDVGTTKHKTTQEDDITAPASRKRKRTTTKLEFSPKKIVKTQVKLEDLETFASTRRSSRRTKQRTDGAGDEDKNIASSDEDHDETHNTASLPGKRKSAPKLPARKIKSVDGTISYTPPTNWETIYNLVADYRAAHPTAPVDTMGCEDLFWRTAPPAQKRYHTLTALMLSSQTKDTMTAAAMQRLHTDLLPNPPRDPTTNKITTSSLTVPNVLTADPVRLNSCIRQVGFHNVKTKNIIKVAHILHEQYNDDIPSTLEGLMSLPGVGPKMAFLTLSAAWGVHQGIGVDVHVHRITNLWGWHVTKTPEATRAALEAWLPPDRWHHINKMLVGFGQTVCLPVGRKCGICPLAGRSLCKSEIKGWVKKEEQKKKGTKKEEVKVKVKVEVEFESQKEETNQQIKSEPPVAPIQGIIEGSGQIHVEGALEGD